MWTVTVTVTSSLLCGQSHSQSLLDYCVDSVDREQKESQTEITSKSLLLRTLDPPAGTLLKHGGFSSDQAASSGIFSRPSVFPEVFGLHTVNETIIPNYSLTNTVHMLGLVRTLAGGNLPGAGLEIYTSWGP